MVRGGKLGALIVAVALVLTGATSSVSETEAAAGTSERAGAVETAAAPVVVAAGDIACGKASTGTAQETCKELQTSDLLLQMNPAAVLTLGDVQYEKGELDD